MTDHDPDHVRPTEVGPVIPNRAAATDREPLPPAVRDYVPRSLQIEIEAVTMAWIDRRAGERGCGKCLAATIVRDEIRALVAAPASEKTT